MSQRQVHRQDESKKSQVEDKLMQEHHSKPATCHPASTSKRAFNGGERRILLIGFQILKNVLNVVRPIELKSHAYV
jgi:hypothetical protein